MPRNGKSQAKQSQNLGINPWEPGSGERRGPAGDGNIPPTPRDSGAIGQGGGNGAAEGTPHPPTTSHSQNVPNPSSRVGPSSNPRWLRSHGKG